jgi:hypothetical protein
VAAFVAFEDKKKSKKMIIFIWTFLFNFFLIPKPKAFFGAKIVWLVYGHFLQNMSLLHEKGGPGPHNIKDKKMTRAWIQKKSDRDV